MRSLLLLSVLFLFPAAASSQSLVPNTEFDDDVSGWNPFADSGVLRSDVTWDAEDRLASPASGSARVTNSSSNDGSGGALPIDSLTCVPIDPNLTYSYGGWVKIPPGQSNTGFARIAVTFYSQPDCSVFDSFGRADAITAINVWTFTEQVDAVPPLTAGSARFGLVANKAEAGGSFSILFDDVFIVPEPAAPTIAALVVLFIAARRGRRERIGSAPRLRRLHARFSRGARAHTLWLRAAATPASRPRLA